MSSATSTSISSHIPLLGSVSVFGLIWLYVRSQQQWEYARCYNVHTFHHVVAICIASTSLYLYYYGDGNGNDNDNDNDNDNNAMSNIVDIERIGIFWSMGYFIIDILDCTMMGHMTYTLHGLVCLVLGLCNYNIPLLYELRMNSRAAYIETSSILLYQVKQRRDPTLFGIFAIVYTCCRIIWIPFMMNTLLQHGVQPTDIIFILLIGFYGLQIWWWIKIIKIIIKGSADDDNSSSKKKKEKVDEKETKKDN